MEGCFAAHCVASSHFPGPTIDIDLLGRTDNAVEVIVALMRQISHTEVTDDGIVFDLASFACEVIREDADYAGVRTRVLVKAVKRT